MYTPPRRLHICVSKFLFLFNSVEGSNAEKFDSCGGHADQMKVYHYHKSPTEGCGETYTGETDQFIGKIKQKAVVTVTLVKFIS